MLKKCSSQEPLGQFQLKLGRKHSWVMGIQMSLKGIHFYISLCSKKTLNIFLSMNHWSECINIWHVTSFGHRLICDIYGKNQVSKTGPLDLLFLFLCFSRLFLTFLRWLDVKPLSLSLSFSEELLLKFWPESQ